MLRIATCDGGKKARLTEEITKEAVKTIRAGNAGMAGVTVVTSSCAFYFAHEASVTGLDKSIPFLRDPLAGDLLLSGIGTKAVA